MLNIFKNRAALVMMVVAVFLVAAMPAFAQSDTITVDTGMFISEINNWLPMALTITAIGVGIAGGFALATMVGRMIVGAFQGRI